MVITSPSMAMVCICTAAATAVVAANSRSAAPLLTIVMKAPPTCCPATVGLARGSLMPIEPIL